MRGPLEEVGVLDVMSLTSSTAPGSNALSAKSLQPTNSQKRRQNFYSTAPSATLTSAQSYDEFVVKVGKGRRLLKVELRNAISKLKKIGSTTTPRLGAKGLRGYTSSRHKAILLASLPEP